MENSQNEDELSGKSPIAVRSAPSPNFSRIPRLVKRPTPISTSSLSADRNAGAGYSSQTGKVLEPSSPPHQDDAVHGETGSVLAEFIYRFRNAAPRSPSERQKELDTSRKKFWWLSEDEAKAQKRNRSSSRTGEKKGTPEQAERLPPGGLNSSPQTDRNSSHQGLEAERVGQDESLLQSTTQLTAGVVKDVSSTNHGLKEGDVQLSLPDAPGLGDSTLKGEKDVGEVASTLFINSLPPTPTRAHIPDLASPFSPLLVSSHLALNMAPPGSVTEEERFQLTLEERTLELSSSRSLPSGRAAAYVAPEELILEDPEVTISRLRERLKSIDSLYTRSAKDMSQTPSELSSSQADFLRLSSPRSQSVLRSSDTSLHSSTAIGNRRARGQGSLMAVRQVDEFEDDNRDSMMGWWQKRGVFSVPSVSGSDLGLLLAEDTEEGKGNDNTASVKSSFEKDTSGRSKSFAMTVAVGSGPPSSESPTRLPGSTKAGEREFSETDQAAESVMEHADTGPEVISLPTNVSKIDDVERLTMEVADEVAKKDNSETVAEITPVTTKSRDSTQPLNEELLDFKTPSEQDRLESASTTILPPSEVSLPSDEGTMGVTLSTTTNEYRESEKSVICDDFELSVSSLSTSTDESVLLEYSEDEDSELQPSLVNVDGDVRAVSPSESNSHSIHLPPVSSIGEAPVVPREHDSDPIVVSLQQAIERYRLALDILMSKE